MTDRRRIEYKVGVNDQEFTQGATGIVGRLKQMAGGFGDTSTTLGKLTQGFGVFAGVMGARQLVNYAGDAIQLAVAAEEVDSKFQAVFGSAQDLEDSLKAWGDMAGVTTTQAKDMAATFGNLAMAQGISEDATKNLAIDVATLAGDMASFNDQDPATVFNDLNKALLTTEREGMKKYGIAITEAEVKTRAAAIAAADGRTEITQADKAYASYAIVVSQAGKAVGDLERTQDSAANVQRQLRATVQELQEEIGQELLPVFADLLGALADAAPLLQAVTAGVGGAIAPIRGLSDAARAATDDSGGFWDQLKRLDQAARNIVSPMGAFSDKVRENANAAYIAGVEFKKFGDTSEIIRQALEAQTVAAAKAAAQSYELAEAQTAHRKSIEGSYQAYASQEAFFTRLEAKLRAMQGIRAPWADWGPPPAYYGDSQYNPGPASGQQSSSNQNEWQAINGGPL